MNYDELIHFLRRLEHALIDGITQHSEAVHEGVVMCVGPAPYRRLDCDGRALAYIRSRPRKRAVRIDISGLWLAQQPSRIRTPSASGAATLIIRSLEDVTEAVRFLGETVDRTRNGELTL